MVVRRAEDERLRADCAENLHRLARALLASVDVYGTRTTFTTHAELAGQMGTSTKTVQRGIARFIRWGLLGVVAQGRSGKAAARRYRTEHAPNEAAVYVLCEVPPVSLVPDLEAEDNPSLTPSRGVSERPSNVAVDGTVHPTATAVRNPPHAPARDQHCNEEAEPLRGRPPNGAAQARPGADSAQWRPGHWYPTSATIGGKDTAWRAAQELRMRLPALQAISPEHVRSICREFFLAGWSVADVVLAVDRKSTGQLWPHDGANGVDPHNIGAWLIHRLRSWRTPGHGTVMPSPSQRAAGVHARERAIHRARVLNEEATRQRIAANPVPHTETAAAVSQWRREYYSGRTTLPFDAWSAQHTSPEPTRSDRDANS